MDLVILKQLLRLAGIRDLKVRFDDPNRQIIATFIQGSQTYEEYIDFKDIENFFTEGPVQATDEPAQLPGPPGTEVLPLTGTN